MTDSDKQKFVEMVTEALDAVVLPALGHFHEELTGKIDGLRQEMNERFERIDERFEEIGGEITGIKGMLKPTIDMVDDHSLRIKRLEKHVNLPV